MPCVGASKAKSKRFDREQRQVKQRQRQQVDGRRRSEDDDRHIGDAERAGATVVNKK